MFYPAVLPPLSVRGMTTDAPRQSLLEELDARQDELLHELDRLNERIEQVLNGCLAWPEGEPAASAAA